MRRPRRPLFLARLPYRRRRLRDAARLLPVFGGFLFILPVLWAPAAEPGAEAGARLLSSDVVYFFGVWAGLVAVSAAFAPGLATTQDEEEED
ncbi:hypothetical protein Q9295_10305 [Xinfangfangia sp. CPCC 101601]|uniref:DUF3311 domain-containing protein n=1 Tax=Pseudogemmobacter lacusdianii TaxID=3069608 RepID=A0ABU0VYD6_9RHOB|nr:hypothetical protein [Xinfangfangia sp. CPCC 101601]MDQ2066769.1 hypothetical protein [Xinfangfangia sp. CPCC 101601]